MVHPQWRIVTIAYGSLYITSKVLLMSCSTQEIDREEKGFTWNREDGCIERRMEGKVGIQNSRSQYETQIFQT